MEEMIDKALKTLLEQVRSNLKPAEALQQSQAVLNMAHAKQILLEGKTNTSSKKQGASA